MLPPPPYPPPTTLDLLLREAEQASARGDRASAEEAWERVLAADPNHAQASFYLGNCSRERGEYDVARAHYERVLRAVPGHLGALNNLGLTHKASGCNERAEACYRAILAVQPQHVEALINLTHVLFQREEHAEAIATSDRLLAIRHDAPPSIRLVRALAQERLQDLAAAEASLRAAVELRPDDATLQAYLGTLYVRQQRYEEAEAPLRRAVELSPNSAYSLSMLARARQHRCAWAGLDELFGRLEAILAAEGGAGAVPLDSFAALAMPFSPLAQLHVAQRWARKNAPLSPATPPRIQYAPGERLRVAFVSANFCEHPTAHLSVEFWERIDRSRLQMYAYSLRQSDDRYAQRIRAAFEHFADVSAESVTRIAQRIRADRIGILIDRNGYTIHAREVIFALRPAPLQINCIGFPGTLGAAWYDYIFTDRFSLPEELTPFYSERPLYMPHMALPSDTTRLPAGPPPARAAYGLPERGFVFCCFNNAYKILPSVFAMWMRLLQAKPGSVLWLLATNPEAQANLRREAARAGVDPGRLVFAQRVSVGEHVARNALADIFLDSYPYGAHTTANDALLAGLPVLTCIGKTMASRIAGSQLHAVGLPELVTSSFADYETLALDLARHPEALSALRARLAANRSTHPLFDMARYARDFADAMEQVWSDHLGKAPV